MPRRSNTTGVRERPSGAFYAENRSGPERINLGTYETAHEATRAYDVAAWRHGHPHAEMNFHDVWMQEQAEDLAPPPRLFTDEDKLRHKILQRQLYHAVEDERLMAEWKRRRPKDIQEMRAFYVEHKAVQKASRVARRKDKAELHAFILALALRRSATMTTCGRTCSPPRRCPTPLVSRRIGLERLEE
ncbi:ethylene-responsive transcription factor 1-like [Lolium rigidum]|uniref:ethylene-responsive transcription factor 1-like n=1 Tax=Lolium rigidum TaxID=89674 RepID=UPI001F5E215F|nr:ethylene-responsive transcription factor 1-like [Lolium rigidum]